ncbi:AraC family transcriptional regulator [Halovulum sp. GXIMD14793]
MALFDRLIWQIEAHLDAPLTLARLSDICAVSQHHMCRAFQQTSGMSIMTYIRARRLSKAADVLAKGDSDILQVALDTGYASHEAFTRAFARYFGVLPSTVRQARSLSSLTRMEPLQMKKDMIVEVAKPRIETRDAFRVVGLSADCSFENISAIPGLWQDFNTREDEVNGSVIGTAYGVCYNVDKAGNFSYLAGIEAKGQTEGFASVDLPEGRYAVFTHSGHISDMPKTVYTIWNKSLSDAGLDPSGAPDFELYDKRFDPQTGCGVVEIWIPVTA